MRKNKKHITREELQKYLRGEMSSEQMHEFERLTSEDSFLSDAMEGYEDIIPNNFDRDLDNLDFRMEESFLKDAPEVEDSAFPYMKVAATVLLLAVASVVGYFLYQGVPADLFKGDTITMTEESEEKPAPKSTAPQVVEEETADEIVSETNKGAPPAEIPDTQVIESESDAEIQTERDDMEAGVGDDLQEELAISTSDGSDEDRDLLARTSEEVEETIVEDIEETEAIDPASMVTGMVVSASGNQPIPNADVGILNTDQRTRTNEFGEFTMEKSGSEDVVIAYADGYSSDSVRLSDDEDLTIRLNTSMAAAGYEIAQPAAIQDIRESKQKKAMEVAPTETEVSIPDRPKPTPEVSMDQYRQYLSDNLIYPSQAEQAGVEGNVILNVKIETDGNLSDVNILLGIGSGCNEEAIRLVQEGPGWLPAIIDGEPTGGTVQIVVPFQID